MAAALIALAALLAGACAPRGPRPLQAAGVTEARVVRAVDGDTLVVEHVSGDRLPSERVRLIGVDTPESTIRTEPYGKEAARFTAARLSGKTVWLTRDVSEVDRYGRALRYVWLVRPPAAPTEDDVARDMFNAVLVREGYATSATYPPDVQWAELFVRLAARARSAGRGLWAPGSADQGADS